MHAKGHVLIISRFKNLGEEVQRPHPHPPCLYMCGKIACQFITESSLTSSNLPINTLSVHLSRLRVGPPNHEVVKKDREIWQLQIRSDERVTKI